MWWSVVLLVLLKDGRSDAFSSDSEQNPHVLPNIPSIVSAFKLVHEPPDCRINLYTVDVGEINEKPISKREDEPITNFVPQYYWDFPCLEKYDYYTFNMMKFPDKEFYLTGCFFFNNPDQRLKCFSLKESGSFEQIRDVACNDRRIWANDSRFYIQIGDETDPDAIALGVRGHKCWIQKTTEGIYSATHKLEVENRVLTYDALYNRNVFSEVNFWKMFVFGWSFDRKPDDYNYSVSSKETKDSFWAFIYMKERFDFIFDVILAANHTATVVIPLPPKGPTCWSGTKGNCRVLTGENNSNVENRSLFCQAMISKNHWDNLMCYKMNKDNCTVYGCQPRNLPGVTPEDWSYCKGNTTSPCQKLEHNPVSEKPTTSEMNEPGEQEEELVEGSSENPTNYSCGRTMKVVLLSLFFSTLSF